MFSVTQHMLRGVEWREFSDYMSPALFDVVSPKALANTAGSFLRAQVDSAGAEQARQQREKLLKAHQLPVVIARSVDGRLPATEDERRARGNALLRLYFHQLIAGSEALLDLGPRHFSGVNPVAWSPSRARHSWSRSFQEAIYDLYGGFYDDNDARFDRALGALGLRPARAVFLAHFGGDTTAVRFAQAHFRETFHAAFVACRNGGSQIHPDFLPMGLMLASLYAHLEPLDLPLDVRAAWRAASSPIAAAA